MNKTNLKRYAPQARKDFIAAVTARAQLLGLSEVAGEPHAEPCQVNGDVAVIAGRPWPASVQGKRERLLQRMKRDGYAATLEAVAYTWFNRFAALRYMELHDYLDHGRRVLSNPDGALPEVLSHAVELAEAGDLPGLQVEQVRQLKLDNQDGELFRRVLIAQCNALHGAMPFLFEAINDETELLLPDNLLLSDSVVTKLVSEIPEKDWSEVEIIGWLYQFYISEKKEEVIGKVVKSEDIPAATQLFTPNWIVQYLVQNSVGRLWLMANPGSTLASQWPYHIQPAEQTAEVQTQLDDLIQVRIREDGEALNPETITVLDPACGSGHILVVAYDALKAIYLERGYQPRAIPRLILEKNLYGLDIDDRAAQLAAFALLMKARADDRRLLNDPPKLNLLSLQESKGLDVDELATHLAPFGLQRAPLTALLDIFVHAKTFGSLIQLPEMLSGQLANITAGLHLALQDGDLYAQHAAKEVMPLVWQALLLGMQFDVVVANPPYMGNKSICDELKTHLSRFFPDFDRDLFSAFILRNTLFTKGGGHTGFMSSFVWMYINTYEQARVLVTKESTLESLIQLDYDAYEDAKAHLCAFVYRRCAQPAFKGRYINLDGFKGASLQSPKALQAIHDGSVSWSFTTSAEKFDKIQGRPVAFWMPDSIADAFLNEPAFGVTCKSVKGLDTCDNAKFVRRWYEPSIDAIKFDVGRVEDTNKSVRWFPYSKGGFFRKWFGNNEFVVDWKNNGEVLRNLRDESGKIKSRPQSTERYFALGINFSAITSSEFSCRIMSKSIFGGGGNAVFAPDHLLALGFLNSKLVGYMTKALNPTLNILVGDILRLPYKGEFNDPETIRQNVQELIDVAEFDWAQSETSWDFDQLGLIRVAACGRSLKASWELWCQECEDRLNSAAEMERINNELFLAEYGLNDALDPDIDVKRIPFVRADRDSDCRRLLSYAIGCMMGRYSLDEPGLIYAHTGNVGFVPSRYEKKFPADADGIVPITDENWFEDDASNRVREFLRAVWGVDMLEEDMAWLAESLGTKGSETPEETIRRYLADKFFKDHLQTYKKRPIYWLFSSGKQGAFQALVYLHRYHEGTLARMRSEYVLPLTGKMQARMESLEVDIRQTSSTPARNKLAKQLEALRKQHHELLAYDEKLRHYADQRIAIDLDDGVKVNYGKFGDLLAEVKVVTGGAGDE